MHEILDNLKNHGKDIFILYVEDNKEVRESTVSMMQRFFNNIIIEAVDGEDGLNKYKQYNNNIDLIITDINMPNMNGIDMISEIKKINHSQQILVVSAYGESDYFTQTIKLGIDGYLLKPTVPEQFLEALATSIEKIHLKKENIEYQKKLEDKNIELEVLNDLLEIKVEKELDKNKLQKQLLFEQSKMASMGEMIESIIHQWRQPLSAITATASSMKMQKELGILNDEIFNNSSDNIVTAALHLSQTIDDFRNFFKTDKEKTTFNLKNPFSKAKNLISPKAINQKIELIENIKDVQVLGLPNELVQVFMNILNNANDALEELEKKEKKLIFIDIYKKDSYAIIKIKDNGGGIPQNIIGKIFESHFTTKGDKNGTGIGLYMTKQIIEEHLNGNIHIQNNEYEYENKYYKGAEFKIKLPIN